MDEYRGGREFQGELDSKERINNKQQSVKEGLKRLSHLLRQHTFLEQKGWEVIEDSFMPYVSGVAFYSVLCFIIIYSRFEG